MSILSTGRISGEKNDYKMFNKMLVNFIVSYEYILQDLRYIYNMLRNTLISYWTKINKT